MMKTITKRLLSLILTISFCTLYANAALRPIEDAIAEDAENQSIADALFTTINEARSAAGQTALTRDDDLDTIAARYAADICENTAFHVSNKFKTLLNGDRVVSLTEDLDIRVTGFSYSAFVGKNSAPETTDEFRKKAIEGDFTRVGVARVSIGMYNAYVTAIIYDKTPT